MRKIIIIIVALILQTPLSRAQNQETYIFLKGIECMVGGDMKSASAIFNTVLEKNKLHAPSNYYYAKIIAMGGSDNTKALQYSQLAADQDPENFDYVKLHSLLLLQDNQLKNALEYIKKSREIKPSHQETYLLEIAVLSQLGLHQDALMLCNTYEDKFSLDEQIIEAKYNIIIAKNDIDAAIRYMQSAVLIFPENTGYMATLADLYSLTGQDRLAINTYLKVLNKHPHSLQAQLPVANFYEKTDNIPALIDMLIRVFVNDQMDASSKIEIFRERFLTPIHYKDNFNKIQQLITTLSLYYPTDIEVRYLYAEYLIYVGELDKALEEYQKVYKQDSIQQKAYDQAIAILHYQDKIPEALLVAQLYNKNVQSLESETKEILLLNLNKQNNKAIEKIDKLIKENKNDSIRSNLYTLKGDILNELKRIKECFKSYKQALRFNSENATALNNYAYFTTLDPQKTPKTLKKALQMATLACEIEQNNPTFMDTKAAVLFELGEVDKAYTIMSEVMRLEKNPSWEIVMRYADILFELGDKLVAKKYWKMALELGAKASDISTRLEKLNN